MIGRTSLPSTSPSVTPSNTPAGITSSLPSSSRSLRLSCSPIDSSIVGHVSFSVQAQASVPSARRVESRRLLSQVLSHNLFSSFIFHFQFSFLSQVSAFTGLISQSILWFRFIFENLFPFAGLSLCRSHLTIFCLLPFSFSSSLSFRRSLPSQVSSHNLFSPFVILLQFTLLSQVSPLAGPISQSYLSLRYPSPVVFPFAGLSLHRSHLTIWSLCFSFSLPVVFPFAGLSLCRSHLTVFCLLSIFFLGSPSLRRYLLSLISSLNHISPFIFLCQFSFVLQVSPFTGLISQSYLSLRFPCPILFRFAGLSLHRSHLTIWSLCWSSF